MTLEGQATGQLNAGAHLVSAQSPLRESGVTRSQSLLAAHSILPGPGWLLAKMGVVAPRRSGLVPMLSWPQLPEGPGSTGSEGGTRLLQKGLCPWVDTACLGVPLRRRQEKDCSVPRHGSWARCSGLGHVLCDCICPSSPSPSSPRTSSACREGGTLNSGGHTVLQVPKTPPSPQESWCRLGRGGGVHLSGRWGKPRPPCAAAPASGVKKVCELRRAVNPVLIFTT